ncbi:fungal-specific transcription factor domain-containing protein [Apodospora peruviana]|uniref:Fungal-specific transcription factor domain-containing protein n=1 Tax=Apodospora peruviana TaxID=516989 RepID=A0AAE0M194_9PEZI|nr:fungal-specific transcription factor domain-containing protein [Apodospora peruviana]
MVRGLEKRKACDLCHVKKIRCDAKKPTCSHCVVYGAQCAYTPHIKRRRKEVKLEVQNSVSAANIHDVPINPAGSAQPVLGDRPSAPGSSDTRETSNLPPLLDLVPIINDYFSNFNIIFPLFDRDAFMQKLEEASASSRLEDPATITAVKIILALADQHRVSAHPPIPSFDPAAFISDAQPTINNLVTGRDGDDLLALQSMLGLLIHYQGTIHHSTQSTVSSRALTLASAIKLVHRLGLHQSRTNALLDDATSLQRTRVFWIAYILDREISMRTHDPPLQQEGDHDTRIPISAPGFGLVHFTTASGLSVDFDIFHARIDLAHIQGAIYKRLYSVRASCQLPAERQSNVVGIHGMLRDWLATVPTELHPNNLASVVGPHSAVRQLVAMYFTYSACFQATHQVGSHDAEWVTRLVKYSQCIISLDTETGTGSSINRHLSTADDLLLEPSLSWAAIVSVARDCARLFRMVQTDDLAMISMTTCTLFAAVFTLIANMLTVSEHGMDSEDDEKLIAEALATFGQLTAIESPYSATSRKMHAACVELSCRARVARARFVLGQPGLNTMNRPTYVAWLEEQARRSAGYSALALVEGFTSAEEKPLATRMWRAGADGNS